MQVLSEDEYLAKHGVLDSTSGYCLDKLRCNRQLRTERGRKRFQKECELAEQQYQENRAARKAEYKDLCNTGAIRPPIIFRASVEDCTWTPRQSSNPSR